MHSNVTFDSNSHAPYVEVCIFTYGQTGSGKTYTMLGGEGMHMGGGGGDDDEQGEAGDDGKAESIFSAISF